MNTRLTFTGGQVDKVFHRAALDKRGADEPESAVALHARFVLEVVLAGQVRHKAVGDLKVETL